MAKDKDAVSKMDPDNFTQTVFKPSGEVVPYNTASLEPYLTGNNSVTPMRTGEYVEYFNSNIDLLNRIINENNTSGFQYSVKEITPQGKLIFNTPTQTVGGTTINAGEASWTVGINPGQWRGTVEDLADKAYMQTIPGLKMDVTTNSVFPDGTPRRGTKAYQSINQYLKAIDAGRVKSGMGSQSIYSRGLWENAVKKDEAVGYYGRPGSVNAVMRTMAPYTIPASIGAQSLLNEKD